MLWVCSKKDIFTEPLGAKIEETLSETLTPLLKKNTARTQLRFVENVDIKHGRPWKALEIESFQNEQNDLHVCEL